MKNPNKSESANLRQKAEELLRKNVTTSFTQLTEAEIYKLLHELETHQVELELQNEELLLAKEQAAIAREKYIELYDFAPMGYFTLTKKGEIIELNLAGAKMLGKDRLRLKNKRFGLYVSDDTKTIFNLFLQKIFSGETRETCEVTLATDGNPHMHIQLTGINSRDEELSHLTAVDITERKKAYYKLLDEQAFRNSIESSLSSGIAIVDDEGRQTYVNPSFCKIFGWSAEELTGKTTPFVYWPTDQLQAIGEAFQLTLANRAPKEGFELVFMCKDGVRMPVQVIITPFYEGKNRTGWLANVIDITQRKQAEEALKESRQRLFEAQKLAQIGVWDWDAVTDSVTWSDELYKIAARDPRLPAPTFAEHAEIYTPFSWHILKTAVEDSMKTGESYELELEQVRPDGSLRNVKAFGGAKFDATGQVTGLYGTLQDITRLKQAEENIKKLNRIYALLSNINQNIVRTRDKQLLCDEACRIAVDDGEFVMAWIGMVNTRTNKVEVVASSGKTGEYLNGINIDLNDELLSSGPTGLAVKCGKSVFSNNIESDDKMIPWRSIALKSGFRSSIALPIIVSGQTIGAYTMYSGETDFFNDDEIKLLDELASDISFALEFIESESERKQAEVARSESSELFRHVFESTNVGKSITMPTGEINVNKAFCDLLGYTREELKIAKWQDITHPDDIELTRKYIDRIKSGEVSQVRFIKRFLHRDGAIIWADISSSAYRNAEGKLHFLFSTILDITAQKQSESKLKESEIRFRTLSETELVGVYIVMQGKFSYVNPALAHMFGYEPSELTGADPLLVIHPDHHLLVADNMRRRFEGEVERLQYEFLGLCKNGETRNIEVMGSFAVINDEPSIIGNIMDITERKKAEESILDLNWRFDSIIQGTNMGTWEWNVQTGETVFNETWAKIIGYSINELAPVSIKTWEAYTHPDDFKQSVELLERHFNGELPYYDYECRMKHKDGHWVWIHDRGSVITRTNDGKPLMMFGTHSDITRSKNAELEILLKNQELQILNASKDKFFSIIAHDLKSPFNSIVGFSEVLAEQIRVKNLEGIENYAQIIKKSSLRAMDLLTNLMEWSRAQTGRMEFNPGYFEMVGLINEVVLLFPDIAGQKAISIRKVLPRHASVFADKDMIKTVLRNLISNATKFSHPGGTIIISVQEQQNEFTISVSDTGVGISEARIHKLFMIDESNSTTGTRNEKGTGLGLILCKEFIEKHNGKIWIESEVGKGTTIFFTLPSRNMTKEGNVIQHKIPISDEGTRMKKLKILIVEDDEISEKYLAIQVSKFAKEVLEAVTGVEAVDICHRNPDIDLVLMDIQLPEMDGYAATRKIREFNKDVIIIAQTAFGFSGDREKAKRAGCTDYYAKPISKDQLMGMIQKYFNSIET